MAFVLTPWFSWIEARPPFDPALRVLISPLALTAPLAMLIILFGMITFCTADDQSTGWNKAFWFLVYFTTACSGAAAYFFAVYKKRTQSPIAVLANS